MNDASCTEKRTIPMAADRHPVALSPVHLTLPRSFPMRRTVVAGKEVS
jgi:hypothetical protein